MRKGMYFSFDSFFAIFLLLTGFFVFRGFYMTGQDRVAMTEFRDVGYVAEDFSQTFSKISMREAFNESFYESIIDGTVLTDSDLENSVVENAALLYGSGEEEKASKIIEEFSKTVPDGYGFDVVFEDEHGREIIFGTGNREDAEVVGRSVRMVSGVSRDRAPRGYMSTASISQAGAENSEYFYFGNYVGEGNVSGIVELPPHDKITSVYMEVDAASNFSLNINGLDAGYYNVSEQGFFADEWYVCDENFREDICQSMEDGDNLFEFEFLGEESNIGGGFIRIDYNRSYSMDEFDDSGFQRKKFPGIDGIINLYDSFEVPGELESLDFYLEYDTDVDIYMNVGNVTLHEGSGDNEVFIDDDEVTETFNQHGIDYTSLSNNTVPLRIGVSDIGEIPGVDADPDVVSVTDVSGNMQARLHDSEYHDKWEASEAANKKFLEIFENATQARAGLSAFNNEIYSYYPLSYEKEPLISEIDEWGTGEPTCVGCGVLMGTTNLLMRQLPEENPYVKPFSNGSNWFYSEEEHDGWNERDFDHSDWENITAPATDQGLEESDSFFFRKEFDYGLNEYRQPFLSVSSSGETDVYLNGQLIDSFEGEGIYWDRIFGGWKNVSGLWHISEHDSVSGETSWYFGIAESRHFMTDKRERGAMESPWIDASGEEPLTFSHRLDIDDHQQNHAAYLEVDYGDGWETLEEYNQPTDGWEDESLDVGEEGALRFRFRFDSIREVDELYEGWYVDDVSFEGFKSDVLEPEILEEEDNVLAINSSVDDEPFFDAELSAEEYRKRSMILLSGGSSNQRTELEEFIYHDEGNENDAQDHTVEAACRANKNHNVTVHSVAFVDEDDDESIEELEAAAECGGGDFYRVDPDELVSVFEELSHDILEASMEEQMVVAEESLDDSLSPESHVNISFKEEINDSGYGMVPLTFESNRFGGEVESPKNGSFYIPGDTEVLSADMISYSSRYWVDRVKKEHEGEWKNVFSLEKFGENYEELGAPFQISIPPEKITGGENLLSVDTGSSPDNRTGGSPYTSVVYEILVEGGSGYGDVFERAEGGTREVDTRYGSFVLEVGNESDEWDNSSDAVNDAFDRLLEKLDVTGDGKIDFMVDEDFFEFETNVMDGLRWIWGPSRVSVEVWKE